MKKLIACLIIFVLSVALVIYGQRTVGMKELGMMCLGLAGVLGLLYLYNRGYN